MRFACLLVLGMCTTYVYGSSSYAACPLMCQCSFLDEISTNCSGQGLRVIPNDVYSQVTTLDISHNDFTYLPQNVSTVTELVKLYASHNQITGVRKAPQLPWLQELDLSYNKIRWTTILPMAFTSVRSLKVLNLSYNPIAGIQNSNTLISSSIEELYLRNCSIGNVPRYFLSNLMKIKSLDLAHNPLMYLEPIESRTLQHLDVSNCNLIRVNSETIVYMPVLRSFVLSGNYRMGMIDCTSKSLELLDITNCNMEFVMLSGLKNLTHAYLRGNNIRRLTYKDFANNTRIRKLDLSNNAIRLVEKDAFFNLKYVESIDLSVNTISTMYSETFVKNGYLKYLNLSRNYFIEVENFTSKSLISLDLSVCEIQSVDESSLILMPLLRRLNLSRNLLTGLPDDLNAPVLEYLDISLCRITDINNRTFNKLSKLKTLKLSGNRFTSGIKASYFPDSLKEITLDDNLWTCDCNSEDFRQLYEFLTDPPARVRKYKLLSCHSPENVSGLPWHEACIAAWYSGSPTSPYTDKMWIYSLSMVFGMTVIMCTAITIRKAYQAKMARERQEQDRIASDARERLRLMALRAREEQAQPNAPDPRELQRPPSYAEAVLMPRLDGSYSSLNEIRNSRLDVSNNQEERRKPRRNRRKRGDRSKRNSESNAEPETSTGSQVDEAASMLPPGETNGTVPSAPAPKPEVTESNL